MMAGSTAVSTGTELSSTLDSYEEKTTSLDSVWKGDSYTSFNSQASEFVGEYRPIVDQLNNFGNACDNYILYEKERKQKEEFESMRDQLVPDTMNIATYNAELSEMNRSISTLKSKIQEALSAASSPSLEATALSANVSSTASGESSDESTSTTSTTGSATPSQYAITPHTGISEEERAARVAMVGGECGSREEQDSKMTTIEVPYWDGQQEQTMKLTVNSNLVDNYQNVFRQLTDMHWTVDSSRTGAYDYDHTPRPSGAPSDHTLGSAIDINWDNNWNTGDGSSAAVRGNEQVIEAFASQGFYWGGDWTSTKDDMHFTFTGY